MYGARLVYWHTVQKISGDGHERLVTLCSEMPPWLGYRTGHYISERQSLMQSCCNMDYLKINFSSGTRNHRWHRDAWSATVQVSGTNMLELMSFYGTRCIALVFVAPSPICWLFNLCGEGVLRIVCSYIRRIWFGYQRECPPSLPYCSWKYHRTKQYTDEAVNIPHVLLSCDILPSISYKSILKNRADIITRTTTLMAWLFFFFHSTRVCL